MAVVGRGEDSVFLGLLAAKKTKSTVASPSSVELVQGRMFGL